jgi:hypothetical protein
MSSCCPPFLTLSVPISSGSAGQQRTRSSARSCFDSELGEKLLDVLVICAKHRAVDFVQAPYICGTTLQLGVECADCTLERAGFVGGTADVIQSALHVQLPWLDKARRQERRYGVKRQRFQL